MDGPGGFCQVTSPAGLCVSGSVLLVSAGKARIALRPRPQRGFLPLLELGEDRGSPSGIAAKGGLSTGCGFGSPNRAGQGRAGNLPPGTRSTHCRINDALEFSNQRFANSTRMVLPLLGGAAVGGGSPKAGFAISSLWSWGQMRAHAGGPRGSPALEGEGSDAGGLHQAPRLGRLAVSEEGGAREGSCVARLRPFCGQSDRNPLLTRRGSTAANLRPQRPGHPPHQGRGGSDASRKVIMLLDVPRRRRDGRERRVFRRLRLCRRKRGRSPAAPTGRDP